MSYYISEGLKLIMTFMVRGEPLIIIMVLLVTTIIG